MHATLTPPAITEGTVTVEMTRSEAVLLMSFLAGTNLNIFKDIRVHNSSPRYWDPEEVNDLAFRLFDALESELV